MELHKRRKALTEPEVRLLFKQTVLAVKYLHDVKVGLALCVCLCACWLSSHHEVHGLAHEPNNFCCWALEVFCVWFYVC